MRHSLPTDLINKIIGFINLAAHPVKSFLDVKQLLEEITANAVPVPPETPPSNKPADQPPSS